MAMFGKGERKKERRCERKKKKKRKFTDGIRSLDGFKTERQSM